MAIALWIIGPTFAAGFATFCSAKTNSVAVPEAATSVADDVQRILLLCKGCCFCCTKDAAAVEDAFAVCVKDAAASAVQTMLHAAVLRMLFRFASKGFCCCAKAISVVQRMPPLLCKEGYYCCTKDAFAVCAKDAAAVQKVSAAVVQRAAAAC